MDRGAYRPWGCKELDVTEHIRARGRTRAGERVPLLASPSLWLQGQQSDGRGTLTPEPGHKLLASLPPQLAETLPVLQA